MTSKNEIPTNRKIDFKALSAALIERVRAADSNPTYRPSERLRKLELTAQWVRSQLFEDGRKLSAEEAKERGKHTTLLSLSSYIKMLGRLKKELVANGFRHPSLSANIARLEKAYPKLKKRLKALDEAQVEGGQLYRAKRDLIEHIGGLIDEKKDVTINKKAMTDLRKLPIYHEIYGLLKVHDHDLQTERNARKEELKARQNIKINYHWIMNTMNDLLDSSAYSRQALGLALASGRRSTEIIYTGRFSFVSDNVVAFSGQLKERKNGVDYENKNEIYTLIPAKEFIEKFEAFRNLRAVKQIHEDLAGLDELECHSKINDRAAKTLSGTAKRVFPHEAIIDGEVKRIGKFKWSRAIWARIVTDKMRSENKKLNSLSEEAFLKEMLGHVDLETQLHYKYCEVDYSRQKEKVKTKQSEKEKDVLSLSQNLRLKRILKLRKNLEVKTRRPFIKLQAFVVETLTSDPSFKFTQSNMSAATNCSRPAIKDYINLVASECGAVLEDTENKQQRRPRKKGLKK